MISPTFDEIQSTDPQVPCGPLCLCSDCTALADDAEMQRLQLKRLGHEPDRKDDQPDSDGRRSR